MATAPATAPDDLQSLLEAHARSLSPAAAGQETPATKPSAAPDSDLQSLLEAHARSLSPAAPAAQVAPAAPAARQRGAPPVLPPVTEPVPNAPPPSLGAGTPPAAGTAPPAAPPVRASSQTRQTYEAPHYEVPITAPVTTAKGLQQTVGELGLDITPSAGSLARLPAPAKPVSYQAAPEEEALHAADRGVDTLPAWAHRPGAAVAGGPVALRQEDQRLATVQLGRVLPRLRGQWQQDDAALRQRIDALESYSRGKGDIFSGGAGPGEQRAYLAQWQQLERDIAKHDARGQQLGAYASRVRQLWAAHQAVPLHGGDHYPEELAQQRPSAWQVMGGQAGEFLDQLLGPIGSARKGVEQRLINNMMLTGELPPPPVIPSSNPQVRSRYIQQWGQVRDWAQRRAIAEKPGAYDAFAVKNLQDEYARFSPWQKKATDTAEQQVKAYAKARIDSGRGAGYAADAAIFGLSALTGGLLGRGAEALTEGAAGGVAGRLAAGSASRYLLERAPSLAAAMAHGGGFMGSQRLLSGLAQGEPLPQVLRGTVESGLTGAAFGGVTGGLGMAAGEALSRVPVHPAVRRAAQVGAGVSGAAAGSAATEAGKALVAGKGVRGAARAGAGALGSGAEMGAFFELLHAVQGGLHASPVPGEAAPPGAALRPTPGARPRTPEELGNWAAYRGRAKGWTENQAAAVQRVVTRIAAADPADRVPLWRRQSPAVQRLLGSLGSLDGSPEAGGVAPPAATRTVPPEPRITTSDGTSVSLRHTSPEALEAIARDAEARGDAPTAARARHWLGLHQAYHASQHPHIPIEQTHAYRVEQNGVRHPGLAVARRFGRAAHVLRATDPELAGKLDDAQNTAERDHQRDFHKREVETIQTPTPANVAPPQVSAWDRMTPEERDKLPAGVRESLLVQSISNSLQAQDPDAAPIHTRAQVPGKPKTLAQLEAISAREFDKAQAAMAARHPEPAAPPAPQPAEAPPAPVQAPAAAAAAPAGEAMPPPVDEGTLQPGAVIRHRATGEESVVSHYDPEREGWFIHPPGEPDFTEFRSRGDLAIEFEMGGPEHPAPAARPRGAADQVRPAERADLDIAGTRLRNRRTGAEVIIAGPRQGGWVQTYAVDPETGAPEVHRYHPRTGAPHNAPFATESVEGVYLKENDVIPPAGGGTETPTAPVQAPEAVAAPEAAPAAETAPQRAETAPKRRVTPFAEEWATGRPAPAEPPPHETTRADFVAKHGRASGEEMHVGPTPVAERGEPGIHAETPLRSVVPGSRVLVYRDGQGRALGTLEFSVPGEAQGNKVASVDQIYVEPEARGQGIGTKLQDALEAAGYRPQPLADRVLSTEGAGLYHARAVRKAVAAGETVPPEVLKDYPKLVKGAEPASGLGDQAAWVEAKRLPAVAALHVAEAGWGPEVADTVRQAVGDAMRHAGLGGSAYHLGGGEYRAQAGDPHTLQEALQRADDYLRGGSFNYRDTDGQPRELKGVGLDYGIAGTEAEARARLAERGGGGGAVPEGNARDVQPAGAGPGRGEAGAGVEPTAGGGARPAGRRGNAGGRRAGAAPARPEPGNGERAAGAAGTAGGVGAARPAIEGELVAPETAAKPLWEMSGDELDTAYEQVKQDEQRMLVDLFGAEGAKEYRQLQIRANSSTASNAAVDAASDRIDRMEALLTPAERERLYSQPDPAEVREYQRALGQLDASSAAELGESLKYAVTQVGQETDPSQMSEREKLAYAMLREGMRLAVENGLDTTEITKQAAKGAAERFGDPNDAAFMLRRFAREFSAETPVDASQARKELREPDQMGRPVPGVWGGDRKTGGDHAFDLPGGGRVLVTGDLAERMPEPMRPVIQALAPLMEQAIDRIAGLALDPEEEIRIHSRGLLLTYTRGQPHFGANVTGGGRPKGHADIFVSPFYPTEPTPSTGYRDTGTAGLGPTAIGLDIAQTILHEIAHMRVNAEGAALWDEMDRMLARPGVTEALDAVAIDFARAIRGDQEHELSTEYRAAHTAYLAEIRGGSRAGGAGGLGATAGTPETPNAAGRISAGPGGTRPDTEPLTGPGEKLTEQFARARNRGAAAPPVAYDNPELEAWHQANAEQEKPAPFGAELREILTEVGHGLTRTHVHLPANDPEYAPLQSALTHLAGIGTSASGEGVFRLHDAIQGLSVPEYQLFTRALNLANIQANVRADTPLAPAVAALPPGTLDAESQSMAAKLAAAPKVRAAIDRWREIAGKTFDDLQQSRVDIGQPLLNLNRDEWYHQEVVREQFRNAGAGAARLAVHYLDAALARHGGTNYKTDWIQAHLQVMADAVRQTAENGVIKLVQQQHDKLPQWKAQQALGKDPAAQQWLAGLAGQGGAIRVTAIPQRVGEMAAAGMLPDKANGEWADVTGALAQNWALNRSRPAGSPAIPLDPALTGRLAAYATWVQSLYQAPPEGGKPEAARLPEGYELYRVEKGHPLYRAHAVTEDLAQQVIQGVVDSLEIGRSDLRPVLAVGRERGVMLLRHAVARTLDDLRPDRPNAWSRLIRKVAGEAKALSVLNPEHTMPLIKEHVIGSGIRILRANPAVLANIPRAAADGLAVQLLKQAPDPEFRQYLYEGGNRGWLARMENVGEPARLNLLARYLKDPRTSPQKAWGALVTATKVGRLPVDFLDQTVRYAAFLHYGQQIDRTGGPGNYGAANPALADAIGQWRGRDALAFYMANHLFGAYNEMPATLRQVRDMMPSAYLGFGVAQIRSETNLMLNQTLRQPDIRARLGRKLTGEDWLGPGKAAKGLTVTVGMVRFMAPMAMLSGLLYANNRGRFGKQEDEMQARGPHIDLGRLPSGKLLVWDRVGALPGLASLLGLDDPFGLYQQVMNGKMSLKQAAAEYGKSGREDLLSLAAQAKMVPEALTGRSMTTGAPIRDWGEWAADRFHVGEMYRAAERLPQRGTGWERLAAVATGTHLIDPAETAYRQATFGAKDWMNDQRGITPEDQQSAAWTPLEASLYYYKKALEYGDRDGAEKYLAAYARASLQQNLPVKGENDAKARVRADKTLQKSLLRMEPLFGMPAAQVPRYLKSLSPADRVQLRSAAWYWQQFAAPKADITAARREKDLRAFLGEIHDAVTREVKIHTPIQDWAAAHPTAAGNAQERGRQARERWQAGLAPLAGAGR